MNPTACNCGAVTYVHMSAFFVLTFGMLMKFVLSDLGKTFDKPEVKLPCTWRAYERIEREIDDSLFDSKSFTILQTLQLVNNNISKLENTKYSHAGSIILDRLLKST